MLAKALFLAVVLLSVAAVHAEEEDEAEDSSELEMNDMRLQQLQSMVADMQEAVKAGSNTERPKSLKQLEALATVPYRAVTISSPDSADVKPGHDDFLDDLDMEDDAAVERAFGALDDSYGPNAPAPPSSHAPPTRGGRKPTPPSPTNNNARPKINPTALLIDQDTAELKKTEIHGRPIGNYFGVGQAVAAYAQNEIKKGNPSALRVIRRHRQKQAQKNKLNQQQQQHPQPNKQNKQNKQNTKPRPVQNNRTKKRKY